MPNFVETVFIEDSSGNALNSTSGSLDVNVTNFPGTQPVSGTVDIASGQSIAVTQTTAANLNATVAGTVAVSNLATDNTQLDSETISSTGVGSTYTTTGYQQLSFQFAGNWAGTVQVLGSNDNTNWSPLVLFNANDGSANDIVLSNGLWQLPVSSKYVQYNVQEVLGSITLTVVGKTSPYTASPLETQSYDPVTGVTQYITVQGGLNKDANNGLILSDAPAPIRIAGPISTLLVIDTQGYQSFNITTQAMAGSVTCSNDGITWSALTGTPISYGTLTSSITANAGFSFPCMARYVRISVTTAGTATVFLRNQPWIGTYTNSVPSSVSNSNLAQVNGNTTVTGGVNGVLAVGGNIAVGVTPTANPVLVAGVDTSTLTRRLLTDTSGRIQSLFNGTDPLATVRPVGVLPPAFGPENIASAAVVDTSVFEGQTIPELLGQILTELRINNFYMFNLSATLNGGQPNPASDEPSAIRNEPSVIN
jgi:hypothetical protein